MNAFAPYHTLSRNELKKIQKHRDWYCKVFPGYLLGLYHQGADSAVYFVNKRFRNAQRIGVCFFYKDIASWFWDYTDLKRVRKIVLARIKRNPRYFGRIFSLWQKEWKKFNRSIAWAEQFDLEKLPTPRLADLYVKVYRSCIDQASYAYITDAFLSTGEDEWLVREIRSRWPEIAGRNDFRAIVQTLHQLQLPSFVAQETMDLLQIAHQNAQERKRAFEHHAKKYYWMENNYHRCLVLGPKYFRNRLAELTRTAVASEKLKAMHAELRRNNANKQKLLISLHAPQQLRTLVQLLDMLAQMQDYRKQAVLRSNHFLFAAAKRVARIHALSLRHALFLTGPEIVKALKGTVDKAELRKRAQASVFIGTRQGAAVYTGKDFHNLHGPPFFLKHASKSVITGTPACPGRVSGRVKLVQRQSDFKEMKHGMILVTNNTTPEYVPIMKKARAIITDQGGLTSHAAIVSRELGIPSVIGTKIATQTLKDGDLVDVDARKGIIRRI